MHAPVMKKEHRDAITKDLVQHIMMIFGVKEPFAIVERPGFRNLWLNPAYIIPNRQLNIKMTKNWMLL
jgi:hypothetical protein